MKKNMYKFCVSICLICSIQQPNIFICVLVSYLLSALYVMIQLFDNYFLMHLTTFFELRDFIQLTKTSNLFREQIVLDYLKQRIDESIVLNISNRIILKNYSLREIDDRKTNELVFETENLGYSYQEIYDNSTILMLYIETITITTPTRQYEWSGYISQMNLSCEYDDNIILRIYYIDWYELQLQIFIDSYNKQVTKIKFVFPQIKKRISIAQRLYSYALVFVCSLFEEAKFTKQRYIS